MLEDSYPSTFSIEIGQRADQRPRRVIDRVRNRSRHSGRWLPDGDSVMNALMRLRSVWKGAGIDAFYRTCVG